MIFAQTNLGPLCAVASVLAVLFLIVGPPLGAAILHGACSLRFRKALAVMGLAVAVYTLVTCLVSVLVSLVDGSRPWLYDPGSFFWPFLLGFMVMSVVAARVLDAPFSESVVVMFIPCVIAFMTALPLVLLVLLFLE